MPIYTTESAVSYVANGGTDYAIQFPFINAEDLVVKIQLGNNLSLLVLGTDYNVTGRTVIFTIAPAAGARIIITRQTKLTQTTKFEDGGTMPAASLNGALDKLTLLCQELRTRVNQTLSVGDFTNISPEDFLQQINDIAEQAKDTAEAARVAAAMSSLISLGKLEYTVPEAASAETLLTLFVDFCKLSDFSADVISIDSHTLGSAFLMMADGVFGAAPEYFAKTDAGKAILLMPSVIVGIDAGEIYYVRSRWSDGVTDTAWSPAVYAAPAGIDDGSGGSSSSLPLSALPDTITGLELSAEAGDLYAAPGHAADATRSVLLRSNVPLVLEDGDFLRNTEYSALLMSKLDGSPALFATAGAFKYDTPWTNPRMFGNDFPTGYMVAASSEANAASAAYRAFDKLYGAANAARAWVSGNSVSYEHRIQLIFDKPKKLSSLKLINGTTAPYANGFLIYVLTAETAEPGNVNSSTGWVQDGAARTGVSTASGEKDFAIANTGEIYGVRLVITSTFSGSQNVRVGEIILTGYEQTRDESIPVTLPAGYSYYREIGRFLTDNEGVIDPAEVRSMTPQRAATYQGRVWISPPIFPVANTLISLAHGLDLSPELARVEIFAKCIAAQDTARVGEIAVGLADNVNRVLLGAIDADNVRFYIPAGLAFYREFPRTNETGATVTTGGSVAMNFDRWALFAKIYY